MWNFWQHALPLLFAAVIATLLGGLFSRWLMKSTQQWEENQHLIQSGERFCDELLESATLYWHMDLTLVGARTEAKILSSKIDASVLLITRFVNENFANDVNMGDDLRQVHIHVTGGNFSVFSRPPDEDRSALSAGSIIQLRFAFSNAIKDSLNYDNSLKNFAKSLLSRIINAWRS